MKIVIDISEQEIEELRSLLAKRIMAFSCGLDCASFTDKILGRVHDSAKELTDKELPDQEAP